jgi:hypothetical protein
MSDAWITPPTFSYGYPASVDDLEVIRKDILYLHGQWYSYVHAILEGEVRAANPFNAETTVAKLWIVHKGNNLYYRMRARSQMTSHDIGVWIRCYDVDGNLMGSHEEEQTVGSTYSVFNNSGAAVDISGWGLSVDTIYELRIRVDATTDPGRWCRVEVNYIYEEA